jgi:hypothetical protein
MALNFPNTPVVGQVYQAEGMSFVWNGTVWHVLDTFGFASNAEAIAGTDDGKLMTPASTAAELDTLVGGSTFLLGVPTNMTASRALNTNYQWTGNRPLLVSVNFYCSYGNGDVELRVGSENSGSLAINLGRARCLSGSPGTGTSACLIGAVPRGWWYRLHIVANSPSADQWWEWRPE